MSRTTRHQRVLHRVFMKNLNISRHEKQPNKPMRLYISALQVLIDVSTPTAALQVEELTPTLIFPRETCLDTLSRQSLCSVPPESDLCCQNHSVSIQSGSLTELSGSPSSPFFNRLFAATHNHGFLEQEGYVSFPSLDLYSQDKRPTPIRN